MIVIYVGRGFSPSHPSRKLYRTFLALAWDKWDDFSYKTQLFGHLVVDGQDVEISNIRILFQDSTFSGEMLEELLSKGWDGIFPINDRNYTSVPNDIDFYPTILGKLGAGEAIDAAVSLRDAGYFSKVKQDIRVLPLIELPGFTTSLLREAGSRKAFEDGWRLFLHSAPSSIKDFSLYAPSRDGAPVAVEFLFNSNVLPYDINVLIGPNGVGKSYCLHTLLEFWLKIGRGTEAEIKIRGYQPFNEYPNISRLILVSYSPFEEFITDLDDSELSSKDAYIYFGFRQKVKDETGESRIRILRNLPAQDAARSICKCVAEDKTLGFLPGWVKKFDTAVAVLGEAVEFDYIALAVKEGQSGNRNGAFQTDGRTYLAIQPDTFDSFDDPEKLEQFDLTEGIVFLKNGERIRLSSGQRLFGYIVINILGAIKYDSLVVVDEPELFLHPNLEIVFIGLLKSVLGRFNSKAILATHSLVTVREVPANCVHVLRQTEYGLDVVRPPFETFGGDIQRISSYVFGDRSVSKPFETWIDKKVEEYLSPSSLIAALGQEINEELMIRIHRIGQN